MLFRIALIFNISCTPIFVKVVGICTCSIYFCVKHIKILVVLIMNNCSIRALITVRWLTSYYITEAISAW